MKNNLHEGLNYKTIWKICRFKSEADRQAKVLYSDEEALNAFGAKQSSEFEQNLLLNEGINELWKLVCGTGGTQFDNAHAYLGVGDSNTAPDDATLTGLQATTNKLYKAMDETYPTYGTAQKATWRATFGADDANFSWNEFTVANGNSNDAKNLNRKVSAQGTKASGQTWELTLEITLS